MENTINLRKNLIIVFVIGTILYLMMWGMFYRPIQYPIVLKSTQDSLCVTPQGWPIPCDEL